MQNVDCEAVRRLVSKKGVNAAIQALNSSYISENLKKELTSENVYINGEVNIPFLNSLA